METKKEERIQLQAINVKHATVTSSETETQFSIR